MSGATLAVGLIPSFDSVGFWAPAFLIVLRLIQGFSTGGEYGGAATFMAEYSPDAKRGFCGSFLEFGTLARSEEHTSELQSLMRISYAVFCLKKKKHKHSQ